MKKFMIVFAFILIVIIIWSSLTINETQETIDRIDAKIGRCYDAD